MNELRFVFLCCQSKTMSFESFALRILELCICIACISAIVLVEGEKGGLLKGQTLQAS